MTRTLLEHPSAPAFLREFQETHLSELAFLLGQRQCYLRDPELQWPDVESLEVRIDRHTEAMQAGGATAIECARELLGGEAPDELSAAAFALVSLLPGGEGASEVLSRLEALDTELLPSCLEALSLARTPRLSGQFGPLLTSKRPKLRALAARLMGHRQDGSDTRPLLALLHDAALEVRAPAVLALAELGHRPGLPVLEQRLPHTPPEELSAWLCAALRLGSSRALQLCRQACQSTGPVPAPLLQVLAMAGSAQDFALLQRLCARTELSRASLEALGILGVPAAVPLLIEHLGHPREELREAAASALELITGAGLTEKVELPAEGDEEDGDLTEAPRELSRPSRDAAAWTRWWGAQRARLEGTSRLRYGKPCTPGSYIEELTRPSSPLAARSRAATELVIRSGHFVGFQPDWPIHRQRHALGQWREWWTARERP